MLRSSWSARKRKFPSARQRDKTFRTSVEICIKTPLRGFTRLAAAGWLLKQDNSDLALVSRQTTAGMGCYKRSGQREPSQIADRLHQGSERVRYGRNECGATYPRRC
nr:hypothetical protein [Salmonella enterica]